MYAFFLIVSQLKVSRPLYYSPRSLREDKVYPSGEFPLLQQSKIQAFITK